MQPIPARNMRERLTGDHNSCAKSDSKSVRSALRDERSSGVTWTCGINGVFCSSLCPWSALVRLWGRARLRGRRRTNLSGQYSHRQTPGLLGLKGRTMAEYGGVKRPKTSRDGVTCAELQRRNAELESENEKLRGRWDHAVLPVTTTVDLSRLDQSLVIQIFSFLGTSRELLSLALTCKSFGWRQPMSTLNWSLVEEVSRQAVCSRANGDEMRLLPRYVSGTTTWLSILHRFEHPLVFDVLLGGDIEHRDGDKTTVYADEGEICTAMSSGYVMRSGTHYAQFKIINGEPYIGIVRPMPGLDAGAYNDGCCFVGLPDFYSAFLEQRSDDWGDGNVHACEYNSRNGGMCWTAWDEEADWEDEDGHRVHWEGMEGCSTGDTLGMLLNLDNGTLTVYKNNRRLGVLKDGLSGPYCWYVLVDREDVVAIKHGWPSDLNDTQVNRSH